MSEKRIQEFKASIEEARTAMENGTAYTAAVREIERLKREHKLELEWAEERILSAELSEFFEEERYLKRLRRMEIEFTNALLERDLWIHQLEISKPLVIIEYREKDNRRTIP